MRLLGCIVWLIGACLLAQVKTAPVLSLYHFLASIFDSFNASLWDSFACYITLEKCDGFGKGTACNLSYISCQQHKRCVMSCMLKYVFSNSYSDIIRPLTTTASCSLFNTSSLSVRTCFCVEFPLPMAMPVGLPGTSTGALGRSSGMRLMPGLMWLRYGLKAMLWLLAREGVTGKEVWIGNTKTTRDNKAMFSSRQKLLWRYWLWKSDLTMGCSWAPGSMNCICWASMAAAVFCWIRLFLPFISSWVLRWGGGCRYLQLSRVQRPLEGLKRETQRERETQRWIALNLSY